MKITYIHHSSFCVELENCVLIFDYFKGEIPAFDKSKKLYIFASHRHYDHFDPIIFNLESNYNNITYILSDDIITKECDNIKFVKPSQNILIDKLKIKTLESTDLGVAFIVNVEDKNIYHAGDLNWWHWENENSVEENNLAQLKFEKQIKKIKGHNFDVAFLPLDPRQGVQFYLGFDSFMKNTNTKLAFPMHFWRTYSTIELLKQSDCAIDYKDKIIKINKENQEFNI